MNKSSDLYGIEDQAEAGKTTVVERRASAISRDDPIVYRSAIKTVNASTFFFPFPCNLILFSFFLLLRDLFHCF